MNKITSLIILLFANLSFAQQVYSTGNVELNEKFTTRIDMTSEKVILTTITPENVWYSIGFGVKTMSEDGDTFLSNGEDVVDAICSGYRTPTKDSQQDWELVSNTTNNGKRTMVVTRPLKTSDNTDYVFNPKASSLILMWALGDGKTYRRHSRGNYGATVAGITLSKDKFYAQQFKILPNPITSNFRLQLPKQINTAHITVSDILGKKIYENTMVKSNVIIPVSNWYNGVYLVKIETENYTVTKKLIKK